MCDSSDDDKRCDTVVITGEFVEVVTLMCKFEELKVFGDGEKKLHPHTNVKMLLYSRAGPSISPCITPLPTVE